MRNVTMFSNLHAVTELKEEVKCETCKSVAFQGVLSECCKQLWCAPCVTFYSKCTKCESALKFRSPPKVVVQKLQQTKVRCVFFSRGCDDTIPLIDLVRHVSLCEWRCSPSRHIVGIDLGTTFSSIGVVLDSKLITIKNQLNNTQTPSVVYFDKSTSKVYVGQEAVAQGADDPNGLVYGAKRLIGEQFSKASIPREWPFTVIEHEQDRCMIKTRSRTISPEEISSYVLKYLKKAAERYLSQLEPHLDPIEVRRAVITVPAHFSDSQRRATLAAAQMAGLEVEMLLNEPTAAAICYYSNQGEKFGKSQLYIVFDFGGGTLDITLVKIKKEEATVLGIIGDSHLGGHDLDCRIAKLLRKKVESSGVSCSTESAMLHAEQIKKALSRRTEVNFPLSKIHPEYEDMVTITRKEFEVECKDLFDRSIQLVKDLLLKTNTSVSGVQGVILAGGSTHIPKISEMLKGLFGKEPLRSIDPSEAIVAGAMITGALRNPLYVESESMMWENMVINDVCAHSLGILCQPTDSEEGYSYRMPMGTLSNVLMHTLIPQFTLIPFEMSHTYNAVKGENSVGIYVQEGEDLDPNNNQFLGHFGVKTPEQFKVGGIKVKFMYDYSGMLTVTASSDIDEKQIQITVTSNQTKSSTQLSNVKELKDNQLSINAQTSPVVTTETGIKELDVAIIGNTVHLRWQIKDSLKSDMKSFVVSINDQEHAVEVSKIRDVKMEYMMPLPQTQKSQQTFNCKVRCIAKSGSDLSWSPTVVAEYIPLVVLQKKHELKILSNANKLLQVFGCSYGQNLSFWRVMKCFSKTLIKIREHYKKTKAAKPKLK